MLNDAEQRRLAEIESWLRTDDPTFVHRFEANSRHRHRRRALIAVLALVIAITITVVALIRGSVPAAVVGLTTVGVSIGLWVSPRRHRDRARGSNARRGSRAAAACVAVAAGQLMDMPGLRSERYPPRLSPTHCRCALPHAAGGHARAARTIDGPPGLETTPAKLLAGLDRPLVVDLAALDRRPRRRDLDPRFRHRGPAPGSNSGRIGPGMSRQCQRLSARGRDRSTRLSLPHPGRHRGPATLRCRCPSGAAAVASGVVQKRRDRPRRCHTGRDRLVWTSAGGRCRPIPAAGLSSPAAAAISSPARSPSWSRRKSCESCGRFAATMQPRNRQTTSERTKSRASTPTSRADTSRCLPLGRGPGFSDAPRACRYLATRILDRPRPARQCRETVRRAADWPARHHHRRLDERPARRF